ncbi:Oidioi.mRNA.OKI2018_I69.YSR.g17083.t1.cds [Oikopleura dioica]|uniref:Oidioi.mRNA.OKI2018_I69.YSR.g17083.t1.cds n=1 Tax=Oikopleura dioica TaxID=34765 RepID=A0ABN7SIL8_OIKDI|nr:Oidioi.mRNA.OKI2018_I69.YSR.g17083.t1.cds [Oikopleura dioica]
MKEKKSDKKNAETREKHKKDAKKKTQKRSRDEFDKQFPTIAPPDKIEVEELKEFATYNSPEEKFYLFERLFNKIISKIKLKKLLSIQAHGNGGNVSFFVLMMTSIFRFYGRNPTDFKKWKCKPNEPHYDESKEIKEEIKEEIKVEEEAEEVEEQIKVKVEAEEVEEEIKVKEEAEEVDEIKEDNEEIKCEVRKGSNGAKVSLDDLEMAAEPEIISDSDDYDAELDQQFFNGEEVFCFENGNSFSLPLWTSAY